MATYTTNLNLEKPEGNESFRRRTVNDNMDKIDAAVAAKASKNDLDIHAADYVRQPGYGAATGSANAYAIILNPAPAAYVDGMAVTVKINVDNTGTATINVNGLGAKTIKKANGNDVSAGNLKTGSIYSLRYNGTNFILQGEGGGGDAVPANVLSGKKFTNDTGEQTGTMPNNGAAGGTITAQGGVYIIPSGYTTGGTVSANISNLTAANINYGINVGGIVGTGKKYGVGDTISMANINGLDTMFVVNRSWLSVGNSFTICHPMVGGFFYIYWSDTVYTTYTFKKYDYNGNLLATFTIPWKDYGIIFDYYGSIYSATRNSSTGVWTHSKYNSSGTAVWVDKTTANSYGGTGYSAWRSVAWDGSSLHFYYQSNSSGTSCMLSRANNGGDEISTYAEIGPMPSNYYPFPMHCSDGSFFYISYSSGYYFRHRNLNGTHRKEFDVASDCSLVYSDGTNMLLSTNGRVKCFSIASNSSYTYLWTANNCSYASAINGYGWFSGATNNNYFLQKFSLSTGIAVASSELYHGLSSNGIYAGGSFNTNYSILTNGDIVARDTRDSYNISLISKNITISS